MTMRYERIPGLAPPLSRLVLGTHDLWERDKVFGVLDAFVEVGGDCIDSAWIYLEGRQEALLGEWMQERGNRDEMVVIGKGAHTPQCDPVSLRRQLGDSLERLRTDHVDLYLMHHDNPLVPVAEFVDVLDDEVSQGRMTAYGFSNWTIERYAEAVDYARRTARREPQALSDHFGLARVIDLPWEGGQHVTDERSLHWLEETQTPLFAWSSQSRGFFVRADPDDRSDADLVRCFYSDDNFERLRLVRRMARKRGVPVAAIVLGYVLGQPFPTFALIGPQTPEEVRDSAGLADVELTPEEVALLSGRA